MLKLSEPVCVTGFGGWREGGIGSWKGSGGHPETSPASEHVVWAPVLMPPFSVQNGLKQGSQPLSFLIYSRKCYSSAWLFHNNCLMGYFISGIRMKWHIHIEAWNCFLLCVWWCYLKRFKTHVSRGLSSLKLQPRLSLAPITEISAWEPLLVFKSFFVFVFLLHSTACGILDPLTRDRTRAPQGKSNS